MKKHFQFQYNFFFFLLLFVPILGLLIFLFILSEGEELSFLIGAIIEIVLFLAITSFFRKRLFSKVHVDKKGMQIYLISKKQCSFPWREIKSLKLVYYLGNIYMKLELQDYCENNKPQKCWAVDKDGFLYVLYRKSLKREILHECSEISITQPLEKFKKNLFIFNQMHLD